MIGIIISFLHSLKERKKKKKQMEGIRAQQLG